MPFNFWDWRTPEARMADDAQKFSEWAPAHAHQIDANLFEQTGRGILDSFYSMADNVYQNYQRPLEDFARQRQQDAEAFVANAQSMLRPAKAPMDDYAPPSDSRFRSEDLGGYTSPNLNLDQPDQPSVDITEPGAYAYQGLSARRDTPETTMQPRGMPMGDIPYRPSAPTNELGQTSPLLGKTSWSPPDASQGAAGGHPLLDAWEQFSKKAGDAGTSLQQGLAEAGRTVGSASQALNDRATLIGQGLGSMGAEIDRRVANETARVGVPEYTRAAREAVLRGDIPGVAGATAHQVASTLSVAPNILAQAADVALGPAGRESVGVPNPLAGTGVGNAIGIEPNARIGLAEGVNFLPGAAGTALNLASLAGSAVENPVGTVALTGGLMLGGRAAGAAASRLARKAGPALAEEAAGQLLGKTPMTAMAEGGLGKSADDIGRAAKEATPETAVDAGGLPPAKPPAPPTGGEPPLPPEQPSVWPGGVKQPKAPPAGAKPITLTPEEEVARLRLDKFPEELRPEIENAARTVDWAREQRRGVIPDAVSESMADDINRTVDQWIKQGKAGKAYNEEETRALRNVLTSQAKKVTDLNEQLAQAASGAERDVLIARQAAESTRLWALTQVAEGARAEAGRSLRAYQQETRLIDLDPEAAAKRLYQKLGGREKAQQALDEYQKLLRANADPITLAKFWSRVESPPAGFADWFAALRYNSMLSGPRSFEINAIGNSLEVPWRLARDTAASMLRGRPEEMLPELKGMWVGMQRGTQAFMETLFRGASEYRAATGDIRPSLADRVQNPLGKKIATVLDVPSRGLQAADDFARMTAYSMGLYREAAVTASREGLRGARWNARIADLVANPSVGMQRRALGIADRMTYQNDMGQMGRGLQALRRTSNPALANIVAPFLRTVYNISMRGIDRSPIGIVGTAMDVAKGKYKNPDQLAEGLVPLGERLGDNIMGGMIGLWFVQQAMQGNVTGAGPDDAQKKDMLRAQGWQPYSVRVGDKWVSYSNWGPVSIPLSMAAAAVEGMRYAKPGQDMGATVLDVMSRFGQLATEQTYLQGFGAVYKSVSDPERYGSAWLTSFLGSVVPFGSALNTIGQMQDPYQHAPDKNDIGQAVASRLPATPFGTPSRFDVPVQKDILGRPVEAPQTGGSALLPIRASQEKPNASLQEFTRLGVDIPVSTGKTVAGVALDQKKARAYQELAQSLRGQMADALMASPTYRQANDAGKRQLLKNAMDRAQAWAAQDAVPGEVDSKGNAREGTEWLTKTVNRDPQQAISGYIKALDTQQELAALRKKRFLGVSEDEADQVAADRALISAYRGTLGERAGDLAAMRELGSRRFYAAKRARENPMYARRAKQLQQSPEFALYMRSGPSVLIQQRPSALQLESAL